MYMLIREELLSDLDCSSLLNNTVDFRVVVPGAPLVGGGASASSWRGHGQRVMGSLHGPRTRIANSKAVFRSSQQLSSTLAPAAPDGRRVNISNANNSAGLIAFWSLPLVEGSKVEQS